MDLTDKDQQLIALLQQNGRLSVSEMARKLSVSRTAVQMRLQKLERNGVINGYTVTLSPTYLEKRVQALVMIKLSAGSREKIEAELSAINQLTSLYSISGIFDMSGVISARSMAELEVIIDKIGCMIGIDETMSSIILSTKFDR
ncbi:MAG: Lrp/AsnC family transcriptional regulator [Amylibacter sp.]